MATTASRLPNFAKLALQFDRAADTQTPDDVARAISRAKQRAEDAEADVADLQARLDTLTDERNSLMADLADAEANAPALAALDAELLAARREITERTAERDEARADALDAAQERDTLRDELADAMAKIAALEDALAAEGVKLTAAWRTIGELRRAPQPVETPPATPEPKARRAAAKRTPEASPRAPRQRWDAKTGQWQPA